MIPFLLSAILFSYFGLQRRSREATMISVSHTVPEEDEGGMGYLESLPRKVVVVYIPLAIFLFVLLFPFYWMGVTSFKTHEELHFVWRPCGFTTRPWNTSNICCSRRIIRNG